MKLVTLIALLSFSASAESLWGRGGASSSSSGASASCSSCVLLTGDQTVAGVKTFSSALTTSVASGSVAVQILSGSKVCLETGGLSCFTSDGTTMNATKKFNSADDLSTGGQLTVTQTISAGTGYKLGANVMMPTTAVTVTGFCTGSAPIAGSTKSFAHKITVGTSACTGISTGTVNLPTANVGWACTARNITTPASNVVAQTGTTTGTAVFTNYARTTGLAADWTANDNLLIDCIAF